MCVFFIFAVIYCAFSIQPSEDDILPIADEIQPSVSEDEIQPSVDEILPIANEIQPGVNEDEIQPSVDEILPNCG